MTNTNGIFIAKLTSMKVNHKINLLIKLVSRLAVMFCLLF